MLLELRMLKDKQLVSMATTTELTRDGELSILIKLVQSNPRDSTRTSVSISIDHSILSQNFHSTELLNATELTMSGSEDGETTLWASNGSLMVSPRLSNLNNGRTIHLTSKEMEALPM